MTSTGKLQKYSLMKKFVRESYAENIFILDILDWISPPRHNSPVLDMKNFVAKHFYSSRWEERREQCPGVLISHLTST
jgi:hypothetical protein